MKFHLRLRRLAVLSTALVSLGVAGPSHAAELTIFAAASLSDALKEIAAKYEPATGDKLTFNFAASSVLARQIKEGAPADLFFSADEAKMNDLAHADLIVPASRHSLLSNTLVIVVPTGSALKIDSAADLAGAKVTRLALAEPQTVPAGIYAKAYLQKLGLWEKVAAKVIPTENVRACLAAVESANVDAGIVYKTDALMSRKVQVALKVSAAEGPAISYPLAILKGSKKPDPTASFVAYLASPDVKSVFAKYGFTVLP